MIINCTIDGTPRTTSITQLEFLKVIAYKTRWSYEVASPIWQARLYKPDRDRVVIGFGEYAIVLEWLDIIWVSRYDDPYDEDSYDEDSTRRLPQPSLSYSRDFDPSRNPNRITLMVDLINKLSNCSWEEARELV